CWGHAVCGHCGGTRHHGTDHAHDMAVLRGHADMSVTGDVCPCPELVAAGAGGRTVKPRATRAAPISAAPPATQGGATICPNHGYRRCHADLQANRGALLGSAAGRL